MMLQVPFTVMPNGIANEAYLLMYWDLQQALEVMHGMVRGIRF